MYRGTLPTKITFTALAVRRQRRRLSVMPSRQASVVGGGIKARCDLLLQWTQPGGGRIARAQPSVPLLPHSVSRSRSTARPTTADAAVGRPRSWFPDAGIPQRACRSIYKRFDSARQPDPGGGHGARSTRRRTSCSRMLTNPTSGGVPGRRSRMVRVRARACTRSPPTTYERPRAWRDDRGRERHRRSASACDPAGRSCCRRPTRCSDMAVRAQVKVGP